MKRSKFNNSIFILVSSIVVFGNFIFLALTIKIFLMFLIIGEIVPLGCLCQVNLLNKHLLQNIMD